MKSKSRLNEVLFRSVCRPVSSGVPELVVYTMLYVPSMVKDDDAGRLFDGSLVKLLTPEDVDSVISRLDDVYGGISRVASSSHLWCRSSKSKIRDLFLLKRDSMMTIGHGDGYESHKKITRYDSEVDEDWNRLMNETSGPLLDLFEDRPDLSALETGELFHQLPDLPVLDSKGHSEKKQVGDGGDDSPASPSDAGEPGGSASPVSTPSTLPSALSEGGIAEICEDSLRRVLPVDLTDLVSEAKTTVDSGIVENRAELVSELEAMVSNSKAINAKARREADLVMRLKKMNRQSELIASAGADATGSDGR